MVLRQVARRQGKKWPPIGDQYFDLRGKFGKNRKLTQILSQGFKFWVQMRTNFAEFPLISAG
jgi:hypothetical protein